MALSEFNHFNLLYAGCPLKRIPFQIQISALMQTSFYVFVVQKQ